ncbi:uncharacterized protein TEOVI_000364000 [Trypanosoma equiperdum]|uniref:Trypanosome variant surface glycoprotein (A-type) n=1 Tax=Trypanosoma equiperdum TaxID=5694 RepID=A0A1G4IHW1_TRYEQ|nr:hypothetical protein TEOVI_000364000 [Trypanosoma equiperdum]
MRAETTGFVLFTLTSELAAAQPAQKTPIDAVNTPCKEIGYLQKLSSEFSTQITKADNRLAELSNDIIQLSTAAALAQDAATKIEYVALFALTTWRAQEQAQELSTGLKALENAVLTLNSRISPLKMAIYATDGAQSVIADGKAGTGKDN